MKKFSVHWEETVVEAHWGTIEADTLEEATKMVNVDSLYDIVAEEGHNFLHTQDVFNIEVIDPENLI